MFFNDERLTHSKFPVWWDFERFIHVFFRHVEEMKFDDIYKDKDNFQYAMKDVTSLIEIVLKTIDKDIQSHF